ncbi:MAG TPA: protein-glutamate O-methyltransferase CheR, partial [Actinomycetota bacterium]|nr:protein-glutamate O-methyltransferase CheR [Actinomycetota bacterium]
MGGSEEQRTALLDYIREQRGVDFASYKRTTLKRRLEKRLQAIGASDYGEYLDVLQASPEEFRGLLDTLFINITQFFRDPKAWNVLRRQLEGRLDPNAERPVRVWCAGVASGEEAYSVAMLLSEILGTDGFLGRAKIYATDVDDDALIQARQGAYSRKQVADIPEELRARYMEEQAGVYTFRKDLRRALIFGHHDLLEDAPISK